MKSLSLNILKIIITMIPKKLTIKDFIFIWAAFALLELLLIDNGLLVFASWWITGFILLFFIKKE